jgi:hypothetical protein
MRKQVASWLRHLADKIHAPEKMTVYVKLDPSVCIEKIEELREQIRQEISVAAG